MVSWNRLYQRAYVGCMRKLDVLKGVYWVHMQPIVIRGVFDYGSSDYWGPGSSQGIEILNGTPGVGSINTCIVCKMIELQCPTSLINDVTCVLVSVVRVEIT